MYLPMFNPTYYLFALPALLLGLYAQFRVKSAYARYLRQANHMGLSGSEVARRLMSANGLDEVGLQATRGELTDHYDTRNRTLFLSQGVAQTASVAALSIVAHEVGHAAQHRERYAPLALRGGLVPIVQLGSWLGPILFIVGMLLSSSNLSLVGLVLFSATLVFSLVTLPVEYDASRRAIAMLQQGRMLGPGEEVAVRNVLSAAALTYVAAAAQAFSTLLYYMTLLGGRRRD